MNRRNCTIHLNDGTTIIDTVYHIEVYQQEHSKEKWYYGTVVLRFDNEIQVCQSTTIVRPDGRIIYEWNEVH